jgi:hypothetical protein
MHLARDCVAPGAPATGKYIRIAIVEMPGRREIVSKRASEWVSSHMVLA